VGTDQSKKFVMVVGSDNKAAYREVVLGSSVDGLRIVTSGLKADERIVVNGLQRIRPGSLVAPQAVQMVTARQPAAS
ncbi:MAG TPA: efflux transporter periplasmic adaptor subunit, partial [Usitatibacter sp.]|nr:efflux transporter periplasmic adaptor subunit [Usitatibacter sp.]